MVRFWEEGRKQRIFSIILLSTVFFLYLGVAYLVYSINDSIGFWALFFSILYIGSVIYQPIDTVSMFLNAKEVKKPRNLTEKKVKNILEELSISAGLKKVPRLFIIDSKGRNAFAVSLGREAAVGVTKGLIDVLNREELSAVIGHEIAHIKNRDSEVKLAAIALVGGIYAILEFVRYTLGSSKKNGLVVFLILVVTYFISLLVFFALSRRREMLADVEAVRYTRNKYAMISALKKVAANPYVFSNYDGKDGENVKNSAFGFLFFVDPFERLFSTHPPIEERIKYLEKL